MKHSALSVPASARPAVLYARVSSRDQEKEGFSIPAQQGLLRSYAAANGFEIAEEFVDVETAKAAGRTGFGAMIAFLKKHPACRTMLVEKTDRLYRNLRDWVTIDELGLEVHLVKENVVLSPDSRSSEKLVHGIKVLMAKNYVDNLSEEARKGMLEKARQGIWPSFAPLGYKNVPGPDGKRIIAPDPEVAPRIATMFERYATGKYSLKQISRMARTDGLAYRKSGDAVPTSTVHKILRNRIYTGDFSFGGVMYRGTHEPLVSRDLWERAQAVLNGRGLRKTQTPKQQFAFGGLITCGRCGCAVVGEIKKGRYVYYHCTGHRGKCPDKYTREEVLDQKFADLLTGLAFTPDVLNWAAQAMRDGHDDARTLHEEATERLQREHRRIQDRLDAMYLDKLDGRIDADFFDRKAADFRGEQARLMRDLEAHHAVQVDAGPDLADLARRAGELFERQPAAEKRRLLDFVVSRCSWRGGELAPEWRAGFRELASGR